MTGGAFVSIGSNLLDQAMVQRVEVTQRLNHHWFCEIECRDTLGSPIPGEEALGSACRLSNTAEDGTEHLIFAGIVIDVALRQEVWGSYSAILRAASSSWLIDHSERNAYFGTSSLNQVAAQLAGAAGDLECMLADRPSPSEYVQYGETNWKFLLRLADDHGGWIRAGLGPIELRNSFDDPEPLVFREEYGLIEFSITGELGPAKVMYAQHDPAVFTSQISAGEQQQPQFETAGQQMGDAVFSGSSDLNLVGFTSRSRSWTSDAMAGRARAEAEREQGSGVTAQGTSRQQTLTAGGAIEVGNLGEADGIWYLTAVTHLWSSTGYLNHFVATPWKQWRAPERPPVRHAAGVEVGRVTANHDPEGRGRLAVTLYWQDGGSLLWAPMLSLHCGAGFGLAFFPEIGDEVLVGFIDSDPERPVILGSLWNGVHQPPREKFATDDESENNLVKRIVTKSGIRIHITDTPGKESISLATPRSNKFLLSEQVAETGRPVISVYTEGDIHLRAAGRIHHKAALRSDHIDGKIMHRVSVKLFNKEGSTSPYESETLHAQLTDGTSPTPAIAAGQHFPAIPPGPCKFAFKNFYDSMVDWEPPA